MTYLKMDNNYDKAWKITKEADGWYYWDDGGCPHGPFETEESVDEAFHFYEISWEDSYYEER